MNQKVYWDKVAPEKEFTTPFRADQLSTYINKESVILDYGCGYGRTLSELSDKGFNNLIGVDFSEEMVKRGIDKYPKINFKVINSGEIPYEDNSFDTILLLAVLTCVYQDEEQNMIMKEIKRVLKPSGLIYINDFMLNDDDRNKERYHKYAEKYGKYGIFELEEGAILRHFDEERIKQLTDVFENIVTEKVQYTTMNGNKSNGILYIGRHQK